MPGDGGYSSSSGSGGGGARLRCPSPLLCTAAGWAAVTEAWALLQYRGMRQRDEQRRADLFHAGGSSNAPQPAATVAAPGAVSIIVPALNEAAGIEPLLTYLQQSLQPEAAEIIVVDGGSSDATVAIAQRCGVRVVQAGRGRARQMNVGAAAAAGELFASAYRCKQAAATYKRSEHQPKSARLLCPLACALHTSRPSEAHCSSRCTRMPLAYLPVYSHLPRPLHIRCMQATS